MRVSLALCVECFQVRDSIVAAFWNPISAFKCKSSPHFPLSFPNVQSQRELCLKNQCRILRWSLRRRS